MFLGFFFHLSSFLNSAPLICSNIIPVETMVYFTDVFQIVMLSMVWKHINVPVASESSQSRKDVLLMST